MDELTSLRKQIDDTDQLIREAFLKRMQLVEQIALFKMSQDMQVYDASREQQVIERNLSKIEIDEFKEYYQQVLHAIMSVSKEYQKSIILRSTYEQVD